MAKDPESYTIRSSTSSSFTTVISIALVLFMLGLLGMLILHAKKLSDYVKENIGLSIIMKDNVKEAEIIQLQKTLDASEFVKTTEYIPKEKAAESLKQDLGEDFISFLGYNPLLASIDVYLVADYANNDSLAKIEQQLSSNSRVKEVVYQKSLIDMVNKNVKKISLLILGFSSLLLIIAIALINNTIRLSIYSKRFLIKSMQLVGATQGFIRWPFVLKGILHGVLGSFIAIALLIFIIYFAQQEVPELFELQDLNLFLILFGIVIVTGVILAWISTSLAVRRYLRLKSEDLY